MEMKNKDNPLVSIIVPAYNVSMYVEKCIFSILEQSYRNIELIVVNDGSTDNSESIINGCIKHDERARMISIKNSGVSAARNVGIDNAKGEYLVFVDGDDFISSEYIHYMLDLVYQTKSEFAFSVNCYTRKGEKQVKIEKKDSISSEDATALLLSPDVTVGCWNKIYKKKLITSNNIRFSTELFYGEGLTFIIEVSQASSSIGVGNKKIYHYRKNNENSATTKFNINKVFNGERALLDIKKRLGFKSKKVNVMFDYHLCLYRLAALVKIKTNKLELIHHKEYKSWLTYIRKNALKFLSSRQLSSYRKLLILVGCISPLLISKLDILRQRQIVANSVDG